MSQITIDLPDDIEEQRKAEITDYLKDEAKRLAENCSSIDDDPAVRAEVTRKIKAGMEDIVAGRFVDGREAMQRIADKHGLDLPG